MTAPVKMEVASVDIWLMLLSTIRYSMGRTSYIVGTCESLLTTYGQAFTASQLRQIDEEINQYLRETCGMPRDIIATWERIANRALIMEQAALALSAVQPIRKKKKVGFK